MDSTTSVAPNDDTTRGRKRTERWQARYWLSRHSQLGRVRACGVPALDVEAVSFRVDLTEECPRAGIAGLMACGSVWACPVCAAKIAQGRTVELAAALEAWHERGGTCVLATFTLRHDRSMDLDRTWRVLSEAFDGVKKGRGWLDDVDDWGTLVPGRKRPSIGYVRAVEVTDGDNGWHTHLHVVFFLRGTEARDDRRLALLRDRWSRRWIKGLKRLGYHASHKHGVDLRAIALGETGQAASYLSKAAAFEVVGAQQGKGYRDSRTPWDHLRAAMTDGEPLARARWAEWEVGSKGKRQVTWALGWRAMLLAGTDQEVEQSDDDLASAAPPGVEVAALPRQVYMAWRAACRVHRLLDALELDPSGALFWDLVDASLPDEPVEDLAPVP